MSALTPMRMAVRLQADEIVEYKRANESRHSLCSRLRRHAGIVRASEPLLAEELERRASELVVSYVGEIGLLQRGVEAFEQEARGS